jgi:hypothetical protein
MKNPELTTGLTGQLEQGCGVSRPATATAARNIPGAAWITEAAVEDTIAVWAPYYGGKLTEAEAVEILMNVKNLIDVLVPQERS